METNVFVYKIETNQVAKSLHSKQNKQVKIHVFDKDGRKGNLVTCLMDSNQADKYVENLLSALNCTNKMQAIFGVDPTNLTPLLDEDGTSNSIVGLESPYGLILKNEVKLYN